MFPDLRRLLTYLTHLESIQYRDIPLRNLSFSRINYLYPIVFLKSFLSGLDLLRCCLVDSRFRSSFASAPQLYQTSKRRLLLANTRAGCMVQIQQRWNLKPYISGASQKGELYICPQDFKDSRARLPWN